MPSRRAFISSSIVLATAPTLEGAALAPAPHATYDFAAVAERLARPVKHRQVFAVSKVGDGAVVGYMNHSMDAYEVAMGEGVGVLHTAAVVYGRGALMGLDDRMWRTYRLAEGLKRRGDILTSPIVDANPFTPEIAAVMKRGATVLVCDNALREWSTYLVTTAGFNDTSIEAVHETLRNHLVPGALLVPAGVAALNQAQEARFTYVQATL